ncbi:MAG TPA: HAMP domain-containing sensor histidine kinase [Gemmatimonas sp.]|nr:HAMP domain-containing sensor histidine kinase [Gemmatimonas sp.]
MDAASAWLLRPVHPLRLAQLRQSLRSIAARRGRETIAWLAIAGTLAAMCFTAYEVREGWEQRRLAAERAVRDNLTTAAVLIGSEAAKMSGLELRALLWPVLGTNGWPNSRPLTLDGFARAGEGVFAAMSNDRGAAQPGYFRLTRGRDGAWTNEVRGALASDTLYGRAVLEEVHRWVARVDLDGPGARIGIIRPNVRGVPIVVGMAPERGPDGRALALFGVAYARTVALRMHVGHVLQAGSLLPAPSPDPADSASNADIAGNSGKNGRESTGRIRRTVDNTALAVRLQYASGLRDVVSPAASDDAVWRSAFVATRAIEGPDGGFTVEVAVPEPVGRRYVDAAMPSTSERVMLGGVLLLGVGFAAAAALGLRRQYKLAEARRLFVAAVSHELRTPLAHVNALSETLLLGRAESPEQAQRWLRAIHREGRRLSVITENVLLHARGERRGIRAAPQWTAVGAIVHDAVSLVEAQAQSRSARIVVVGTAVDGTVGGASGWVDAAAVRQIVINFIENALKFGPDGQTVTVTLDLERPVANGNAHHNAHGNALGLLRLSVDDEGPGVPRADRDRIWKPFVRLAEGGSAPAGTGLGLSVVRQLVEEMGGRWSVSDMPGRGTRFTVEMPLAMPPPGATERAAAPANTPAAARHTVAAARR